MCDLIIYSHEVGVGKPDKRIFEIACEQLGVQPAEMIFVDEVAGHLEAARKLGIQTVLFKDTTQTITDIQSLLAE